MAVPTPPTQPIIRNPPYPGGGPSTGGGGTSGGSTAGASAGVSAQSLTSSNGGVLGLNQVALYPCTNMVTGKTEYRTFDPTQTPNDPNLPSSYTWRIEQGNQYTNPTVRKLFWTFFDLGQVAVTWTLTGVTELQKVVTQSIPIGVGNFVPTKAVMTVEVDINLTAMNLQLSVAKLAGAGPLSILRITLVGNVDDGSAT
jgi:hypothetical protein